MSCRRCGPAYQSGRPCDRCGERKPPAVPPKGGVSRAPQPLGRHRSDVRADAGERQMTPIYDWCRAHLADGEAVGHVAPEDAAAPHLATIQRIYDEGMARLAHLAR